MRGRNGADWKGCRVLIVGSTGWLGSRLASALGERGAQVAGLAPFAPFEPALAEHRPRLVMQLDDGPGREGLLGACEAAGCVEGALVATSGGAVASERALPVAFVRTASLYGPGDLDWNRLIPRTIRSVWRGEVPVLAGDGGPRAEYLYVDDAVAGWLALAAAALGELRLKGAFDLGTGTPFSVPEVVREVLEVMGSEHLEPRVAESASAPPAERLIDASRARATFGWEARHTLRQGLIHTIAWYARHLASVEGAKLEATGRPSRRQLY